MTLCKLLVFRVLCQSLPGFVFYVVVLIHKKIENTAIFTHLLYRELATCSLNFDKSVLQAVLHLSLSNDDMEDDGMPIDRS